MNRVLDVPRRKTTKPPTEGRDRINFRCDPDWYLLVASHAASMGMDITNYIRYACNKQIDRDVAEKESLRHR